MKTKVNHSEILESLKNELEMLTAKKHETLEAWRNSGSLEDGTRDRQLFYKAVENDDRIKELKREINFHTIMMQEKKYATEHLWSDAHAYEIIEEKTATKMLVRQLKATIKPEARKALHESFIPGGFCGHFDNDLQEWDFEVNENNPIIEIRKHKNGRWYASGKRHFTIEAQPREYYDYNF